MRLVDGCRPAAHPRAIVATRLPVQLAELGGIPGADLRGAALAAAIHDAFAVAAVVCSQRELDLEGRLTDDGRFLAGDGDLQLGRPEFLRRDALPRPLTRLWPGPARGALEPSPQLCDR